MSQQPYSNFTCTYVWLQNTHWQCLVKAKPRIMHKISSSPADTLQRNFIVVKKNNFYS